MSGWLRGALVAGMMACLAACGGPPPPPPTLVTLTMTAAANVNPDPSGQGAPVVLRIYQLASPSSFTNAEFFDLFNSDQTALKTDLLHRDDIPLAPGATQTLNLMPNDQVTAVGIFAGYRDWQKATWREVVPVAPHKTTDITVSAGQTGLTVKTTVTTPKKSGS